MTRLLYFVVLVYKLRNLYGSLFSMVGTMSHSCKFLPYISKEIKSLKISRDETRTVTSNCHLFYPGMALLLM